VQNKDRAVSGRIFRVWHGSSYHPEAA
jgi:hypothetical protein